MPPHQHYLIMSSIQHELRPVCAVQTLQHNLRFVFDDILKMLCPLIYTAAFLHTNSTAVPLRIVVVELLCRITLSVCAEARNRQHMYHMFNPKLHDTDETTFS